MHTSEQRFQSIHGALLGMAIGDALAMSCERHLGRQFALSPLHYSKWPLLGLYTANTQLAFIAGQAILQSRSQSDQFHDRFGRRLRWFVLSLPVGLAPSTLFAGLKVWLEFTGLKSAVPSQEGSSSTRGLLFGVVLHNTGHRYMTWAHDSAEATHSHPLATDAAVVMATASQIAGLASNGRINKIGALQTLVRCAKVEEFKSALSALEPFLLRKSSPRKVAEHFHWCGNIHRQALQTTIMAVYCFLHFPTSFERALKSAILLSNDGLLATLVGGLLGAHLGAEGLPEELVDGLSDWPVDRKWIESLATRLEAWPHGADDLITAPPLPSNPIGQAIRNAIRGPFVISRRFIPF